MLLDDLVTAIRTVQDRIRDYRDPLGRNEYRTRISLIDPVLNSLGWDVSDPALVTIEDEYSGGRADYVLLNEDSREPLAILEAKRLGQYLNAHEYQVSRYTWGFKVSYGGLTDGDRWRFWEMGAESSQRLNETLILDVTLSSETAYKCALKLLLLWRHSLTDGKPLEANEPILDISRNIQVPTSGPEPDVLLRRPPDPDPLSSEWISLCNYRPHEDEKVAGMRLCFPDGTARKLEYWWELQGQVAEWLIQVGTLTSTECPVSRRPGWNIIHSEPLHSNGRRFAREHKLSNGLFLEKDANRYQHVECAKFLLTHFGHDLTFIYLKPN